MNVYVFLTPRAFWDRPDVAAAVAEASAAARRLAKVVDEGRERLRLVAALQTIDHAARLTCPSPRVVSGEEGATMVAALPVVGATRLPFKILDQDQPISGLVLAPVPYDPESSFASAGEAVAGPADQLAVVSADDTRVRGRLVDEVAAARRSGRPVPLGRTRHAGIMAAIRANLGAEEGLAESQVHFVYSDGSVSGPVAVGFRREHARPAAEVEISVGLNSCRHFELDPQIDHYLLRTADFERRADQSFAEQEAFAYGRMEALLTSYRPRSVCMTLYHTGLEPAVIGSYRAIIDALRRGQPLIVLPVVHPSAPPGEAWW